MYILKKKRLNNIHFSNLTCLNVLRFHSQADDVHVRLNIQIVSFCSCNGPNLNFNQ